MSKCWTGRADFASTAGRGVEDHMRDPEHVCYASRVEHCDGMAGWVMESQAAPLQPWPQVAAELGSLDETREKLEADKMAGIQR